MKFLLDSSAWLAYLFGESERARELVENVTNMVLSSPLSLHEVGKKLRREAWPSAEVQNALLLIKRRSVLVPLDEKLCEDAIDDCLSSGLSTVDALIYRSALNSGAVLVTGDSDFKHLKEVELLK